MEITQELISYLETLSRFHLTSEEKISVQADLEKVLNYINVIDQLNTDNIEAMPHVNDLCNQFRVDEVTNSDQRQGILKNAPQQKDGAFKVPKTVD